MIEFHTHVAAVAATRKSFDIAAGAGEFPEAAARLTNITDRNLPLAWFGSCVDALLLHADSDGSELALLDKASGLWQQAIALYEELRTARIEFE
jgi:hypothetical protein